MQTELVRSKDEIKATIKADVGHTSHEADFEYTLVLSELRQHFEGLNPKDELAATRQIELGHDSFGRSKSTSIAYIVPSTHVLLYSVLSPVCAAIAAGSCVIVEVSRSTVTIGRVSLARAITDREQLPQNLRSLTSTLRRVLCSSLDADTFAISDSRPATDFLQQCTLVLQSQPDDQPKARRACLSPSSLRALAVVDRTADVDKAAQAVVRARFSRRGTSPYAPDVVLVNEFVLDEFLACLLQHMSPYLAHGNGSSGNSSKEKEHRPFAEGQRILDAAEKSEDMRVVIRGSNGNIISVQSR